MGFTGGTSSFTRFRILDPVPQEFWRLLPDKLRDHAFRDIDETPEMSSCGWVNFDDMLDTAWRTSPPQKADYILFSLRQDKRRIPAGVIKKHFALALNEEKEKLRQQSKNFISRDRRKEIREQVLMRLRMRFLPIPGEFNVIWLTSKNEVWFASTQGGMIDLFLETFLASFGLHLEQLTPYNLATTLLNETSVALLDHLEAASFVSVTQ